MSDAPSRAQLEWRIEELEAQCEALQNKCARRGLSPEDSDALQADNERLRAVYEAVKDIKWRSIDKDNMEFSTTCFAVDRIREALTAAQEIDE